MLTVRRSGQRQRSSPSSRACRRRHDIQRGIHVRVALASAMDALEFGLRLAARRIGRAAAPARLAGIHGRNHLDVRRLVLEHPSQLRPAGIQDFPVESRLLPGAPARMLCRAPGGSGHGLRFQVLNGEQSGGAGDPDELSMPGPRSGMKPIRDGTEFGGIVHAADATFLPQASERSNVVLWAILSTYPYKSHLNRLRLWMRGDPNSNRDPVQTRPVALIL